MLKKIFLHLCFFFLALRKKKGVRCTTRDIKPIKSIYNGIQSELLSKQMVISVGLITLNKNKVTINQSTALTKVVKIPLIFYIHFFLITRDGID